MLIDCVIPSPPDPTHCLYLRGSERSEFLGQNLGSTSVLIDILSVAADTEIGLQFGITNLPTLTDHDRVSVNGNSLVNVQTDNVTVECTDLRTSQHCGRSFARQDALTLCHVGTS